MCYNLRPPSQLVSKATPVLYKLLLLFILVPLVELTLLLMFAQVTGSIWWSVLLVLVTGTLGAWLARRQGLAVIHRIRHQLANGTMPTDTLIDGAMIFFAGGLLLTPGVLTDLVGLSLMIPTCRRWYKSRLVNWFKRNFQITHWEMPGSDAFRSADWSDDIVDGQVVRDPEQAIEHSPDPSSSQD